LRQVEARLWEIGGGPLAEMLFDELNVGRRQMERKPFDIQLNSIAVAEEAQAFAFTRSPVVDSRG
jgi:hypothetical protein